MNRIPHTIAVKKDLLIDSLYAWVDKNSNSAFDTGEPCGFYHTSADPGHAKTTHVRDQNVTKVDFSIP